MKEDKRQRRERHSNNIYNHGKPKLGCRPLAELFQETYNTEIGKSQMAKIVKSESNIRREYENFEGDMKREKIAKYGIINDVLYEW